MANQISLGPSSDWDINNEKFIANRRFGVDSLGRIITTPNVVDLSKETMRYNTDINNPAARVGDYVYVNGTPELVPNSMTDLTNRYQVIYGGTEKPEANIGFTNVGGGAVGGAALGATTGAIAGSFLPGPGNIIGGIAGALIGGIAGGVKSYFDATDEALKNWNNEKIKYDTAVDFYRDENGTLKYKLDYQKVAAAGPRSEQWAKDMQNQDTSVTLGDDGRLKVTVSPIFASTERFKEIMDWISENYAGLSRNTENYESILKQIQDGIDGEVKSYNTNMQLYADYATKFPEASPESIVPAYMTEIAGYVDPEKMSEYSMAIIGDDGVEVKSAQDFFNSVYDMSKDDRNRLVSKLNDIIYGTDEYHTDDEKAVALGEMRSLYAVSNNAEGYKDDKYQGMMDADWFVSFINHFAPLGIQTGDVLNFISGGNWMATKQEFLNQDDMAGFIGIVGGTAAGLGLFKGGTALIEKGLKLLPGSSNLFSASIEGTKGGVYAFFESMSSTRTGAGIKGIIDGLWQNGRISEVGKAFAASAAFKTLKLGIFDSALAGTKTLVSGTDFWSEFGQDLARDAALEVMFSYYDMVKFEKAVYDPTKKVYRNTETGKLTELDASKYRDTDTIVDLDNVSTSELVGAYNFQKTRSGSTVGVAQSEAGTLYYVDGQAVFVSPSGEQTLLNGGADLVAGYPALNSGVAVEADVSTSLSTDVDTSLERMGLPSGTEIMEVSARDLSAAHVAGQLAKFDTTKFGLAVNKAFFNKNALLDAVNEMALSKDADLTAWQNRSQDFVSIADSAKREVAAIAFGNYVKATAEAFDDYQMALGKLNLTKKISKADNNYLKAIRAIEVASLFNKERAEGDTRDYLAEALEKYAPALNGVSPSRALDLNDFQVIRKKRNDMIKASAKKSGKIDVEALDNVMESDIQTQIGWVPQWRKKEDYNGLLSRFYGISQKRNIYKTWLQNGRWVDLNELEDPVAADDRFLSMVATNMGQNNRKTSFLEASEVIGLVEDNTPSPAEERKKKYDSIKNKDEVKKKLTEMVEERKKEIRKNVPTQKQYVDLMQKNIEESGVLDAIENYINPKIYTDYTEDNSIKTLEKRQKLDDINNELETLKENENKYYDNWNGWVNAKPAEGMDESVFKKLRENELGVAKVAKKRMGYNGSITGFKKWFSNKVSKLEHERDLLSSDIQKERGESRAPVQFDREFYQDKDIPTEYIENRSDRQKISDDILGVWNGYNDGLANAWLNNGDVSVKKELRKTIEDNPKLRAALLSTMYDNSGSNLPYSEWLNTPIVLKRQQTVDSLRPEDAFMSFSMQKNWGGIGGLIPRTDALPGDIITLEVKPKDTLGEIPKGIEAEDELEVLVPREVYATAMTEGPIDKRVDKNQAIIDSSNNLFDRLAEYNDIFGYKFDIESYENTKFFPNIKEAINSKDMGMASAIVNEAVMDAAPYQSRSQLLKSAQEAVAADWRAWAEAHVKGGKLNTKELKKFVKDNDIKLSDSKASYPNKVKNALWEMYKNGEKLPEIDGFVMPDALKENFAEYDVKDIPKDKEQAALVFAINLEADKSLKKSFYKALDDTELFKSVNAEKRELVDLIAADINGETFDAYEMGAATDALGMGGRVPFPYYYKGKPVTKFLKYSNDKEKWMIDNALELFTDKQLVKQPGIISRIASSAANTFRLFTTALDVTRAPLNYLRDTGRGSITSGGWSFINAKKAIDDVIEMGDYTPAQKEKLHRELDNVLKMVGNETYNAAYRDRKKSGVQATKEYLSSTGANPFKRFAYSLVHDPLSILEAPANFFEGATRKRLARSSAAIKLRQLQSEGASFKKQYQGMVDAAFYAGREYTANFARKGQVIEQTSKYVAYQSSAYAGFDGFKRAFINNPKGVATHFAMFVLMYMYLLADTLSREKARKNYYRLSDYDRGNSIVITLDDETILTIPMDQELAGFIFPYRRLLETLNGTDPASFFEFIWGTFTDPLPVDMSGFTEGDGFNLGRGLQKFAAQNMPTGLSGIQEAATGYDLYYGSDLSVDEETLKRYGIYNPEPGDYTTSSKDSLTLRRIANTTGIPQWQLQTMVSNYGGNVGSYVLNIIDKLSGATKEQQGGKSFADAIFKSFTATDQDAASSAFYSGIRQLQKDKHALVQKIANYNEDLKVASGDTKIALQAKLQQAKDDYATKVGDFVDKYLSAYEITGGLSKSQAMQVYYLFRLDDDDTVYQSGSVEEYYSNKALQRFKNEASAMSAPILDKYYNNRIGNIYQDSDGVWRHYMSSGAQAMRNSVYGESEEHMVSLLNLLEGKGSNMKNLRTQVRNARSAAYDAKDYDLADKIGYEFDLKVVDAISPYIEQYGAENVLGTSEVLDYLSDWFFVPDNFKKTKRGGYVSLGNNASSQEAFVRPYIKYLFGLPTNYSSYSETSLTSPSLGEFWR